MRGLKRIYRLTIVGLAGFTVFLALTLFSSPLVANTSIKTVSAESPFLVTDKPIGADKVLKIKSMDIQNKKVKDNEVDLVAEAKNDGLGLIFKTINKVSKDKNLEIDSWRIDTAGKGFAVKPVIFSVDDKIKSNESKTIKELDFEDKIGWFELFPGDYAVTIYGFNSAEAASLEDQFDEQEIEFTLADIAQYVLTVNVHINYDKEILKQSHVVKNDKTELSIDGTGNIFEVSSDNPKQLILSLKNTFDKPVSGLVTGLSYNVRNVDFPDRLEGVDRILDPIDGACIVLQPGETIFVEKFILDKSKYPLGNDNGLSKKIADQNTALEGMYLVHLDGYSSGCSVGDQFYEGYTFSSILALEVK